MLAHRSSSEHGGRRAAIKTGDAVQLPCNQDTPRSRFTSERSRMMKTSVDLIPRPRLSRISLFQECSSSFLEALTHQLEFEVFTAGTEIFTQGDVGNCMFLLNSGEVEVVIGDEIVASLDEGSLFGEMAAISKHAAAAKRTATVRAKTICQCWKIERSALLRIASLFPKDEAAISLEANRRMRDLERKGLVGCKEERPWGTRPRPATYQQLRQRLFTKMVALNSLRRRPDQTSNEDASSKYVSEAPCADGEVRLMGEMLECGPDVGEQPPPASEVRRAASHPLPARPELDSSPYSSEQEPRAASLPLTSRTQNGSANWNIGPASLPSTSRTQNRSAAWNIGESSELRKVRNDAIAFLARREIPDLVQKRFSRRKLAGREKTWGNNVNRLETGFRQRYTSGQHS